ILTRVELRPSPDPSWMLRAASDDNTTIAQRDDAGYYVLRRRPGKAYTLSLAQEGRGTVIAKIPPDFKDDVLTVTLPAGSVHTAAVLRGQAVSGLGITIRSPAEPIAWGVTDRQGNITIPFLAPGTYQLKMNTPSPKEVRFTITSAGMT